MLPGWNIEVTIYFFEIAHTENQFDMQLVQQKKLQWKQRSLFNASWQQKQPASTPQCRGDSLSFNFVSPFPAWLVCYVTLHLYCGSCTGRCENAKLDIVIAVCKEVRLSFFCLTRTYVPLGSAKFKRIVWVPEMKEFHISSWSPGSFLARSLCTSKAVVLYLYLLLLSHTSPEDKSNCKFSKRSSEELDFC